MKTWITSMVATFVALFLFVPAVSHAQTISLDSVTPELVSDITPEPGEKEAFENFYTYWFIDEEGGEYRAVFNVSEQPAFVFVTGGDMTLDSNWSYDEEEGQIIVTYTAVEMLQISSQSEKSWGDGETLTVIAVSFVAEEGTDGPGIETQGGWIATPFQEWSLLMPNENTNQMGASVSADPGASGRFKMWLPDTAISSIGEGDGQEGDDFDAHNMGIYEDDEQVSGNVKKASGGGAFINFVTTLPEESNDGGEEGDECGEEGEGEHEEGDEEEGEDPCGEEGEPQQSITASDGPGVSQKVTARPRERIAMTANKSSLKKGKKVTLTGWIKSGNKNKKVSLLRKIVKKNKKTKFKKVKTVRTSKAGKFRFKVKVKKKAKFKAKQKKAKTDPVTVTLK